MLSLRFKSKPYCFAVEIEEDVSYPTPRRAPLRRTSYHWYYTLYRGKIVQLNYTKYISLWPVEILLSDQNDVRITPHDQILYYYFLNLFRIKHGETMCDETARSYNVIRTINDIQIKYYEPCDCLPWRA